MTGNTTDARDVCTSIYGLIHQIIELLQLKNCGRAIPEDAERCLTAATALRESVKQLYGIKNASEAQPDSDRPSASEGGVTKMTDIPRTVRDECWATIRRGVETGVIKHWGSAMQAAGALRTAYSIIYGDRFSMIEMDASSVAGVPQPLQESRDEQPSQATH